MSKSSIKEIAKESAALLFAETTPVALQALEMRCLLEHYAKRDDVVSIEAYLKSMPHEVVEIPAPWAGQYKDNPAAIVRPYCRIPFKVNGTVSISLNTFDAIIYYYRGNEIIGGYNISPKAAQYVNQIAT